MERNLASSMARKTGDVRLRTFEETLIGVRAGPSSSLMSPSGSASAIGVAAEVAKDLGKPMFVACQWPVSSALTIMPDTLLLSGRTTDKSRNAGRGLYIIW